MESYLYCHIVWKFTDVTANTTIKIIVNKQWTQNRPLIYHSITSFYHFNPSFPYTHFQHHFFTRHSITSNTSLHIIPTPLPYTLQHLHFPTHHSSSSITAVNFLTLHSNSTSLHISASITSLESIPAPPLPYTSFQHLHHSHNFSRDGRTCAFISVACSSCGTVHRVALPPWYRGSQSLAWGFLTVLERSRVL